MIKDKNLSLEGLRGLASLSVVVGHFTFVFSPYLASLYYPTPGVKPRFSIEAILAYPPFTLLFSADAAVCVFFVMSGYVLTTRFITSNSLEGIQTAAAKRYVRLVLPTAASILFAWLLWKWGAILTKEATQIGVAGWVEAWYRERLSLPGVLFNALLGAPLFAQTGLNPPVWTIQVELIGSIILFSMTALFFGRPVLFVAWSLFFANILGFKLPNVLFYVAFFAGSLLNYASDWLRRNQNASCFIFIIGLVGVSYNYSPLYGLIHLFRLPNLGPIGPDFNALPRLFWHTAGATALVAGVIGWRKADNFLSRRAFVYLGRISFSMYLVHMPIIMSIALGCSKITQQFGLTYGQAVAVTFPIYICSVIVIADLFYRAVDRNAIGIAAALSPSNPKVRQLGVTTSWREAKNPAP